MNNKGFTLIEMLIYIAIFSIVVIGFISFALSISDSRHKSYVMQEVQANTRTAFNIITQKILSADGVNDEASVFDSDSGILSLSMNDSSKNPTIISLDGDNGRLQITEGTNDPIFITSDEVRVSNLLFTKLNNGRGVIKLELEIEFDNQGTSINYGYNQKIQTAVSLRQ